MGAPLGFSASLALLIKINRQGGVNFYRYHLKTIAVISSLLLAIILVLFILVRSEIDFNYLSEYAKEQGHEIEWYLQNNPDEVYFASVGITIISLPFWFIAHKWLLRSISIQQRRSGHLDFFFPAPMPSQVHFWYLSRRWITYALVMPLLLLTLVNKFVLNISLPFDLWLRMVYVLTSVSVTLVTITLFFGFILPSYQSSWTVRLPRLLNLLAWGWVGLVLLKGVVDHLFGQQNLRESVSASLLNPLVQGLLAYPTVMAYFLSSVGYGPRIVGEALFLGLIPLLLVIYIRLKHIHLHELPLLPSRFSMGTEQELEHRETLPLVSKLFWNLAWPPLPRFGNGYSAYFMGRIYYTFRGPLIIILIAGWSILIISTLPFLLDVLIYSAIFYPDDIVVTIVVITFYYLLLIPPAFVYMNLRSHHPGQERILPYSAWSRYFIELVVALIPFLVFLGGAILIMSLATITQSAFVWHTFWIDTFDIEMLGAGPILILLCFWTSIGVVSHYWIISSVKIIDSQHNLPILFGLGGGLLAGLMLVHIILIGMVTPMNFMIISLVLLSLFVIVGYYPFSKIDVRS